MLQQSILVGNLIYNNIFLFFCFPTLDSTEMCCVCYRFCLKNCPPNDLECALSPYALEYKLLSLPFGIAANQDLIRLVAYTQDGVMHPRTTFLAVDEDVALPFALRDENLKGVLFTTQALRQPHTYRMKVRALSYSEDGGIEYQTTFIVYIAVSAYPYWEHFKWRGTKVRWWLASSTCSTAEINVWVGVVLEKHQ